MDDVETICFSEELHAMSVKLASFSEGFDTKELDEMSVQLSSLVAHLDTKTPVGQLPHTEDTEI